MENTRPLALVAVIAVGAAACSKPKVNHVVELTGSPKTVEVRITVDGKIRGPYRLPTPETVLPVDLGGFEQPPVISVQALLPCGSLDVPVKPPGAATGTAQRHFARVPTGKLLGVWVDNRGGGQIKASLGQIAFVVSAGVAGSYPVPAPGCAEATKLRVGDAELEVVRSSDLESKDAGLVPAYLVDTSGARCYRSRQVHYGQAGLLSFGRPDESFRSARHHKLFADVDHFLQTAPETLHAESRFPWKHELTEVPCTPRPR